MLSTAASLMFAIEPLSSRIIRLKILFFMILQFLLVCTLVSSRCKNNPCTFGVEIFQLCKACKVSARLQLLIIRCIFALMEILSALAGKIYMVYEIY